MQNKLPSVSGVSSMAYLSILVYTVSMTRRNKVTAILDAQNYKVSLLWSYTFHISI